MNKLNNVMPGALNEFFKKCDYMYIFIKHKHEISIINIKEKKLRKQIVCLKNKLI